LIITLLLDIPILVYRKRKLEEFLTRVARELGGCEKGALRADGYIIRPFLKI
jgi:hypothetical protein